MQTAIDQYCDTLLQWLNQISSNLGTGFKQELLSAQLLVPSDRFENNLSRVVMGKARPRRPANNDTVEAIKVKMDGLSAERLNHRGMADWRIACGHWWPDCFPFIDQPTELLSNDFILTRHYSDSLVPKTEPPLAGGAKAGEWQGRDQQSLGVIAKSLVYEVASTRVNSLPSPWSRALQFEQAVRTIATHARFTA